MRDASHLGLKNVFFLTPLTCIWRHILFHKKNAAKENVVEIIYLNFRSPGVFLCDVEEFTFFKVYYRKMNSYKNKENQLFFLLFYVHYLIYLQFYILSHFILIC